MFLRGIIEMLYDAFICHASEDKESFVRQLAEQLRGSHLQVWYDEFTLDVGDSLRDAIDAGLRGSRFGLVILSPHFFNKNWPKKELNGLFARETASGESLILPIWHGVSYQEIVKVSPLLADRKALNSNSGLDSVCRSLLRKIRPSRSPLIIAQQMLIAKGLNPPVISDEWWLDIVEASNRIPAGGFSIPEDSCWERWSFPLPNYGEKGEARGITLAWVALQLNWSSEANGQKITQITHPDRVHDFIVSQPGLSEMCHKWPHWLGIYSPQLTILGFGGEFESDFDEWLQKCKEVPEALALRDSAFGGYRSEAIACRFVQGDIGGPPVMYYDIFDYLIWFLCDASNWLPVKVHHYLLEGMMNWGVWTHNPDHFIELLYRARSFRTFRFTKTAKKELEQHIDRSLNTLHLHESPAMILKRFLDAGVIESWFKVRKKRESAYWK
jgi:hypothetical protein